MLTKGEATDPVVTVLTDYYLILADETGNILNTHKMISSRNRNFNGGDGKISTRFFELNIKDDDLKKSNGETWNNGDKICWYIVDENNTTFYYPYHAGNANGYQLGWTAGGTHGTIGTDNKIEREYYNEAKSTTAPPAQQYFYFNKGASKSYTFVLDSENSVGMLHAPTGFTDAGSYYLVGNFTDTKVNISIDPSKESDRKLMTRYHYLNTTPYTDDEWKTAGHNIGAGADSIVYKVHVDRPASGSWGPLYLDIAKSSLIENWSNDSWKDVIRPLIFVENPKQYNSGYLPQNGSVAKDLEDNDATGWNIDGRAVHGGLIEGLNRFNSINPAPTDKFAGYDFTFNVTTATYRLQFISSLAIIGNAVQPGDKSQDAGTNLAKNKVVLSDYDEDMKAYKVDLYLTQGQTFYFVYDIGEQWTYNNTWSEDDNAPYYETHRTDDTKPVAPGGDTQFFNRLAYHGGTGNESHTDPDDAKNGNGILFDLPTGRYTMYFYDNHGTENASYYTLTRKLDMRDVANVKYNGTVRNVKGCGDYNFFRPWSDYVAYNKPSDIDVYIVTGYTTGENGLTSVDLTLFNNGYIPANVGVLLAGKASQTNRPIGATYVEDDSGTGFNQLNYQLTVCETPTATYGGTDSKLTPLYESKALTRFDYANDGETIEYANYLFGFYRTNKWNPSYTGDENDFDLGFWLSTGVGTTTENGAYLHLRVGEAQSYNVGTTYGYTSADAVPCFFLFFDDITPDIPDAGETTGIMTVVDALGGAGISDNGWYTLQGVRLDTPHKGIYIHNGRKVIIK